MIETKKFILAGNATLTVTSKKTGVRFTFKVRQPTPEKPHFVKLLSGPDNENDYQFFGTIFEGTVFRHSSKARISPDAPAAKAFAWLWSHLGTDKLSQVEIHHEGRCCRCGRKLTVPESIESGIGPECAQYLA